MGSAVWWTWESWWEEVETIRISSSSSSTTDSSSWPGCCTQCFRGALGGWGILVSVGGRDIPVSGEDSYTLLPSWQAGCEITCASTCCKSGDTCISSTPSVESSNKSSWSESSSQLNRGGEEIEERDLVAVPSSLGGTYPSMLSNSRPISILVNAVVP